MKPKPRFNPVITRVKLNPEQAILACACWMSGSYASSGTRNTTSTRNSANFCFGTTRRQYPPASWSTVGRNRAVS
jgi:hypothetical protein